MAEEDDPIVRLKREAFGDLADQAELRATGSGISETQSLVLNLLADPGRLGSMPPPWTENRAMIVGLFSDLHAKSLVCPGTRRPQCCQAAEGTACAPRWRQREDVEWYAQEINKYLSMVDRRLVEIATVSAAISTVEGQALGMLQPSASLAADEAFELGCLVTEVLRKLEWDRFAIPGQKSARGAREGGFARRSAEPRRRTVYGTVAAVDALLQTGKGLTQSYRRVAKEQGVSEQTIAKEYRKAKKQG